MSLVKEAIKEEITADVQGTIKALKELRLFIKPIPFKVLKTIAYLVFYFSPIAISLIFMIRLGGIGFLVSFFVGFFWIVFWIGVQDKHKKLLDNQKMEKIRKEMR